jgi:hypothetical protein
MLAYGWYRDMHPIGLTHWVDGRPYRGKDPIYPINVKGMMTHSHICLQSKPSFTINNYLPYN